MRPAPFALTSLVVSVSPPPPEWVVFGHCEWMQAVREKIQQGAGTNLPVLIQGENGTGKEFLAKYIHWRSLWQEWPFVKVSCHALRGSGLERQLFPWPRGFFTGVPDFRTRRVEQGRQGTLFLDEITDLDEVLQAKLWRVLEEGEACRFGGPGEPKWEVRIICTTHRHLKQEVDAGGFHRALFYRINGMNLQLPALRERSDDIPGLAAYFLELYNEKYKCRAPLLSPYILKVLRNYDWPGNIRQLENLVKRYVILGSEEAIISEITGDPGALIPGQQAIGSISLREVTRQAAQELEREIILKVLQAKRWNRKQAAQTLNISYRALLYKIKEAGLPSKRVPRARQPSAMAINDSAIRMRGTNEDPG